MIGFQTIAHQGHAACKANGFDLNKCPYPKGSQAAKEWIDGHFKATRGEHWNDLPKVKPKRKKMAMGD